MKLAGKYRLVVEGDLDKLRIGYSTKSIGYLFERLLTGQDANMDNLSNLGVVSQFENRSAFPPAH